MHTNPQKLSCLFSGRNEVAPGDIKNWDRLFLSAQNKFFYVGVVPMQNGRCLLLFGPVPPVNHWRIGKVVRNFDDSNLSKRPGWTRCPKSYQTVRRLGRPWRWSADI